MSKTMAKCQLLTAVSRYLLTRLFRFRAFVVAFVDRRYRIEILLSGLHFRVTEGGGLHWFGIQFYRWSIFLVTEDVVAGEVGFGIGRPYQVNEWGLTDAGEHRLQSGGHGGRKNIVGENRD